MTDHSRRFDLIRNVDETGVSGTGRVAWGVQWPSGKCSLAWSTEVSSVAVYDSIEDLVMIHGHGGKTVVSWVDSETNMAAALLHWACCEDLGLAHDSTTDQIMYEIQQTCARVLALEEQLDDWAGRMAAAKGTP